MKMQSLLLKKQEKSAIKGMKYKAFAFLPGFLSDCHSEAYLLSEGSLRHTSTGWGNGDTGTRKTSQGLLSFPSCSALGARKSIYWAPALPAPPTADSDPQVCYSPYVLG